jgi:hypothetical protein
MYKRARRDRPGGRIPLSKYPFVHDALEALKKA